MNKLITQGVGRVDVTVDAEMTAHLNGHVLHPVYATFWACYHAEVAARRAIEPYFDEGEDAVGSALSISHHAMAGIGSTLCVTARVDDVRGSRIRCAIEIRRGDVLIADGFQEQVILPSHVIKRKIDEALAKRA